MQLVHNCSTSQAYLCGLHQEVVFLEMPATLVLVGAISALSKVFLTECFKMRDGGNVTGLTMDTSYDTQVLAYC